MPSNENQRNPLAGVQDPITLVIHSDAALQTIGDASASTGATLKTTGSLGSLTYALKVKLVDDAGADIGAGTYYLGLYAES